MTDRAPVSISSASGPELLRLARSSRAAGRKKLRTLAPEQLSQACQELRPEVRSEFLMLVDRPEDVVPLLPPAEIAITIRSGGMSEAAWLLEVASPEQRIACVDVDCWGAYALAPERVVEWVDALIEAGRPTLVSALHEWDPEVWTLALAGMADVLVLGKEDEPPPGWQTEDGVVYWRPRAEDDFARVKEIAGAAFSEANPTYWKLVYGLLFELPSEMEEYALRWHDARLADLGFPSREQALELYSHLAVEQTPIVEPASDDEDEAEEDPLAGAVVPQAELPSKLQGTVVGEALSKLPASRALEILGYVLGVANGVAVADQLRLSESESIPKALEKAVRGMDQGLLALARARRQEPHEVLDRTRPSDLFRIGATLDDTLQYRPLPPDEDDEEEPDDAAADTD